MGNKQILAQNNETLASILSNVLGLPSQESLKHGAYVWKKYTLTYSETSRANAGEETISDIGSLHTAIKVYMSKSYTFDEATGMFTLVNPTMTTVAYGRSYLFNEKYYFMVNGSTGDKMFESAGISSSSHQTRIYNLDNRVYLKAESTSYSFYVYSNTANKTDFVDFVVSDSSTAYPDGGEYGGYWYEKVVEGKTGIDYGEISIVDSSLQTLTINHSLGVVPSIAVVYPKNATIYRNETKAFFGSFGAALTAISTQFISPIWSCNTTNNQPYLSNSIGGYGSSTATKDTIAIIPSSYWVTGTYIWFAIA